MVDDASFLVSREEAGLRLDRFLARRCPDLSRSRLQALIAAGEVEVAGLRPKASRPLKAGELITLRVPPPVPLDLSPEPIPLDVVYEDEQLLVVVKPAGLVVHPGAGHSTGTLVHALLYHCPNLSGIGGVRRPGIVHRLDRGTSGLLVVAKTDRAHRALSAQLKARSVERRYLALVNGRLPHREGVIETAIGRDPRHRLRMAVRPVGQGKAAVTHFTVLEAFDRFTSLEARLKTGRTHQIRVHLSHLGFPVVGDETYRSRRVAGAFQDPELRRLVRDLNGFALHAATLGFTHPVTGVGLEFSAPLPAAFERLLAYLRTSHR
ncbi:MAG: RluA family pseudouridine synthase [Candidatus Rokubacteria bacterium]|nr:RluA family pseudouridine synthase [Candidatus Rokubacteria bacterium]